MLLKQVKESKFWSFLKTWGTRFGIVAAIIGSGTVIYTFTKSQVVSRLQQPLINLNSLIDAHDVTMGLFMDLMDRLEKNKELFVVFDDGVKREAMIFATAEKEEYVFVEDRELGQIAFRCYYSESRGYWYFFSFDDNPYTVIYEK